MRTLIKMLERIGAVMAVSGQRLYAGPFWYQPILGRHDARNGGRR